MGDVTNRETVEKLYRSFAARDGEAMATCYAADATFTDPVFIGLRGREVGGMWRMLTARGKDLRVESSVEGSGDRYTARWTARYSFSLTKRQVVNHVTSTLTVKDGLIVDQRDEFDLAAWMAQALGPFGSLLGWTGLPAYVVRSGARKQLAGYLARHP